MVRLQRAPDVGRMAGRLVLLDRLPVRRKKIRQPVARLVVRSAAAAPKNHMIPAGHSETIPAEVSVVICCYNSAARLPETLRHLARQVLPKSVPWEVIIVVDNHSTDDTAAVALRVWQETGAPAPLRLLEETSSGKSFALETGFAAARYGILVIVDDDNWLNPDYLKRACLLMQQHPGIGVLGGKITAAFEGQPPAWFEKFQSCYAVGAQGKAAGDITDYKPHVAGAGMVVRKSAYQLLKQRGFRPMLSGGRRGNLMPGEDLELCYAMAILGYRIWYDEALNLAHFMPKSRLTQDNLLELIRHNRIAEPILSCYEAALRRPGDSAMMIYLRNLRRHAEWAMKSIAKFLLGRQDWLSCQLQWLQFRDALISLPELRRAFKLHYPEVLKLKQEGAAR